MKNKIKGLILLIFSFTMMLQPIFVVQASSDKIEQTNVGSMNGVYWAYNQNKERVRTSSLTVVQSATVDKSSSNSKTIQTNMQLIVGTNNVDFYSDRYVKFVMRDGADGVYKQEKGIGLKGSIGNTTGNVDNIFTAAVNAFYRYDWASKYILNFDKSKVGLLKGQDILGLAGGQYKAYTNNIYLGTGLNYPWFTTNVTVSIIQYRTVPLLDIFQQKYGEMSVPELNITYLFDQNQTPGNLADDQVTLIEHIIPKYQLITVKTQSYPVTVKQSTTTSASLTGSYNFTGQYSETNIGDEVLISDGNNFVFGWYGLESTTINYNQSGGFTIQGGLSWIVSNDITFSNGTDVPENIRMPWWRSSNMSFNGLWSHAFSSQGTIFGKGALQTIVEAIRTRASTSAQDQLLIWANIIPSTMFGYSDTDNSGDASVRLNGSSLQILDTIMAVGLAQGVNIQQTNHVNAQSFWQLGTDVLSDKNDDVIDSGVSILNESWGVDPNSAKFSSSTVDFSWTTPVENNGKVTFKWGIAYNKFPVTWAITDGSTEILNHVELMDLGYDYTLTVDPTNGEAVLSNTYENSGFQNATVKAMANQLSFATYKRDLFLGMQKSSDQADSTEAVNQDSLKTSFGSTEVVDQVFGGTKQQYSLTDGSTYDSQTTVVNVITGTGTSGEPESVNVSTYSPFASSWFGRKVGLSLLKWSADNRTQNSGVNWQFRENIVITAYPTWKGQGIVHDPTYSAVYTPREGQNPSSNTSSTKSAPWDLSFSLIALLMVVSAVHIKRKRNGNN